MWYNCLKILHILSAAFLLVSMVYSYHLWKKIRYGKQAVFISQRIQTQTLLFIIPFALIQLATGFTMISLQHNTFSQWWISGSVIGFIIVIGSWFSFMYFLLVSQQLVDTRSQTTKHLFFKRAQSLMLSLCAAALLGMIFLMANKSAIYANSP